jgi:phage gp36-like protein
MAYSTLTELQKRFPSDDIIDLTDDERDGEHNATAVAAAIADADAEIDTYLASRVLVPVDIASGSIPPLTVALLLKLSCDITRYNLHSRLGGAMDETVKARYDAAIRKLEQIAAGKLPFDITTVVVVVPSYGVRLSGGNVRTPLFSSDDLDAMGAV